MGLSVFASLICVSQNCIKLLKKILIWLKKGLPIYLRFQTETQRRAEVQPK